MKSAPKPSKIVFKIRRLELVANKSHSTLNLEEMQKKTRQKLESMLRSA